MGCFLEVTTLEPDILDDVMACLSEEGIDLSVRPAGTLIRSYDFLNLASITIFLKHVLSLEGITDLNEGFTQSRFRQLPWQQQSVWVPTDQAVAEVVDGELFVGSAGELIRELQEVAARSHLSLSQVVPERLRDESEALADDDTIKYIWQRLREGAELAIAEKAFLQGV